MTTIDGPVNAPDDWDLHYDFDHYETGDIITWHTATVASPVQIIVTGDGFDVYDLKKGGNFEKWGSYVMEKLFSIEPYKTYKDCFNVVLAAALSNERGVSIGDNKKDTYFGVGWQDATHYGSMMNATSRARLQSLAQQIPGYSSTRSFALVLCNTDTYGGLCYWSQRAALASMCLNSSWTAPRSLTWNGRWDTSTGQTSGDVANLVAHELGGHAIGYLTDEYPSSEFNRTSILSNQLVGFANNLALDKSNPGWKSFKQEIQEAGGYATGNAAVPYVTMYLDWEASQVVTSVLETMADKTASTIVASRTYYSLDGRASSEPYDGVNVVVTTYSDGHRDVVKQVVK